MTTTLTQATTIEIVEPKVFEQNGKILTTSFDVAAYFRKRHDDVLKKFEPL